jgi:hypothetical protein
MIIKNFRHNKDRSNICAVTARLLDYGIGIDKIEHVLEFKEDKIILDSIETIIPENESLLDKAKRLYPIGTKFIANNTKTECIVTTAIYKNPNIGYGDVINEYSNNNQMLSTNGVYHNILDYSGKWAEIISKPEVKEEPLVVTSSLKDMLTLQKAGVKNVIQAKSETLLEKAQRLYPIGTKFEALGLFYPSQKGQIMTVFTKPCINTNGNIIVDTVETTMSQAVISKDGSQLARIQYNGYKVGDTFNQYGSRSLTITKLETINGHEVAFFKHPNGYSGPQDRILIKNIRK